MTFGNAGGWHVSRLRDAAALLLASLTLALPALASDPPIPAGTARIHYYRPDNNFTGWTLWTWGASTENQTAWCSTELNPTGTDAYGAYWDVTVNPTWGNPTGDLGFIVHNCAANVKDPGPDMHLNVLQHDEAWVISGDDTVYTTEPTRQQLLNGVFHEQQAYWVDRYRIAIQPQYLNSGWTYYLNASLTGGLQLGDSGVTGGSSLQLTPGGTLTADELARYPQLAGYAILQVPGTTPPDTIRQMLRGQVVLSATSSDDTLQYATGIQIAGVLDDLTYYGGKLGVIFNAYGSGLPPIQLKLWAPTARGVSLEIFDQATDTTPAAVIPMSEANGVWEADGNATWNHKYYLYQVRVYVPADGTVDTNLVTDPYSVDISVNGTKSRITNLDAADTKPADWDASTSPPLHQLGDMSIYELSVRDFSIGDSTVPAQDAGMYEAFADPDSDGMRHLRALAGSGLKAVEIMPAFHFASVNEDKSTWQTTGDLSGYPPDGTQQQQAVSAIQQRDGYNWGYDPVHYMTPAGSYAIDPNDRVKEFRTMIEGLHEAGLRVILDVVFNHTAASGEAPNSNLDEIVPGYYHRLDADGRLETGSCCADTASEHRMMEKLMIDTVVLWAREYKADGFRFDIMSFHFTYNMRHIQQALAALTPESAGVDGSRLYLLGEGWNFGDTYNSQIGPNASQLNLYGYGIGTFNDRIRDGIRGGGPFSDERVQGFATGLFTDPSSYTAGSARSWDQKQQLLQESDWIRIGLAGNLRDYAFTDSSGTTVTGAQVDYNGQPAGYTATPVEDINYCSVHDGQDLFDAIQLKSSSADDIATRARRQVVAMSLIELGEGVPFFYGGDDMLRSKDMDANSYDSGDWFNRIDWSGRTANWGIGLPVASQNGGQWWIMQPLLANPAYDPQPANIAWTAGAFQEFMRIRYSSGLFRMTRLADIQSNLAFLNTGPNQVPGLIVMKLDDVSGAYGGFKHVLVVFNATGSTVHFADLRLQGLHYHLHPVLLASGDPAELQSDFDGRLGAVDVPALTTAVFVQ